MNKGELIEKLDIQKKYGSKIIRIALLPIFGYAGFGIFAMTRISFVQRNRICFSSCYLFIIFFVVGIIFWLLFRNMRRIGLVCSKCQKMLDKETALTTLKCGKCRDIIITGNGTSQ